MTQYALAKATGKSRSYISELCSGKIAEPTLSVAFSSPTRWACRSSGSMTS